VGPRLAYDSGPGVAHNKRSPFLARKGDAHRGPCFASPQPDALSGNVVNTERVRQVTLCHQMAWMPDSGAHPRARPADSSHG
jgi:hypothetical protein